MCNKHGPRKKLPINNFLSMSTDSSIGELSDNRLKKKKRKCDQDSLPPSHALLIHILEEHINNTELNDIEHKKLFTDLLKLLKGKLCSRRINNVMDKAAEIVLHPDTEQRMKKIMQEVFDTIVNLPTIPSTDPPANPVHDAEFIQQLFEYEQKGDTLFETPKPNTKLINNESNQYDDCSVADSEFIKLLLEDEPQDHHSVETTKSNTKLINNESNQSDDCSADTYFYLEMIQLIG